MRFFCISYISFFFFPLFIFAAEKPSLVELERRLAAQKVEIARLEGIAVAEEARITALERAKQPKLVISDPATQAFADLPYVVRIRIKDSSGVNFGTGSVILSKSGQAVILTAGHIFKKFDEKSKIEVDIFNSKTGKVETVSGNAMKWDLESDVGLLSVPMKRPINPLPIAPLKDAVTVGQHVMSYGCGGGNPPSPQEHNVTAINRYLGPDNVECQGVPVQGRSGGALVDARNRVVGVVIAADTRDQRGLYAGLRPIHDILIEAGIDPTALSYAPPPLPKIPKK